MIAKEQEEISYVPGRRNEPAQNTPKGGTWIFEHNFVEKLKSYMATVRKGGLSELQQQVQNDLDSWKAIKLHIALVGQSGSGKSALINAMLGLTAEDESGADCGVTETTEKVKMYCHPERLNLVLWDLPGVDTPNFTKERYWENVKKNVADFDFFIIVSSGSFKESDIWFAKDIQEKEKKFFFVRTQVDLDIIKDKLAYPKTYKERNVQETVKKYIFNQLKKGNVEHSGEKIFLVNNFDTSAFDFQNMMNVLIKQAPTLKREAFVMSLAAGTQVVIDEKVKVLESRIPKIALLGSLSSAIPIPGTGLAVELGLLYCEAKMYREQLGIDEDSLIKMSKRMGLDVSTFKDKMQMKNHLMFVSATEFLKVMSYLATSEGVETVAKYTVPIVGSIAAGMISYPVCCYTLKHVLNTCKTEASNAKTVIGDWLCAKTDPDIMLTQ
ncbi:T-cell-specific guanine nucleotide triphosphate-binding protein 2-like isoform X2 [Mya arenaria]|uniref:T-cell-specific guanine nucleotide triphosphate-binding protein 2-like isoform X2 n=1 Tax=Mya arenaria TaxID=6604 RepID=UPI0022E2457C|nr:T-cell-specific guanine nucleotide triphosphate-binding protein 2-like isoform X2 [Mya arenaria]